VSPAASWLDEPHHDGSDLHVEPGPYALGDTVAVRLRVPHGTPVDAARLRSTPDAEPRYVDARVDRTTATDTWWVAELSLANPSTNYRWVLSAGRSGSTLNAAGRWPHEVTDAADFRIGTAEPPPAWLAGAVGYQIFPDRFARSRDRPAPDWAIPAAWDDPVDPRPHRAVRQWYGGDLPGIEQRLDHLVDLGVDVVYLTPFFPARSSHRYDASSFDTVDPHLGGDDALASLVAAAHRRGIRVVGDLTTNHTGDHHAWFRRAVADATAPEAGYYLFRRHPDDYVAWYGVRTLPKLDHRDDGLRRRLVDGPDSVTARWLGEPWALDGWRVDCANVTARHDDVDVNAEVARAMRATMATVGGDDRWLVAEHCYDATTDLDGAGWHGVMAYQWFTRPLAQWLATVEPLRMQSPIELPRLDAAGAATSMRHLAAGAPWSALQASMTVLDTHDTARFRTLVGGDRERHLTAMTTLMTWPGVPTLFAGSEVGVTGASMDAARVPFPWDRASWDGATYDRARALIALRHDHGALRQGGLRWVHADAGSMTYLRETADERVLVHLAEPGADAVTIEDGRLGVSVAPASLVAAPGATARLAGGHLELSGTGVWHLA
jgi:alpha-glucosidase